MATQQQMVIAAPGDVTVQKLPVTNGQVKAGDTLATLSSIQLTRYQAMLNIHTQMVAIEQRPFSDGRVDQLLQLTQAEATSAQTAFNTAQAGLQAVQDGLELGTVTDPSETPNFAIELEDRRTELATINNELADLPKSIQDAKDRLALAVQQLAIQSTALAALSALLTVVAPADGQFVASVGQGGFVKKGGEIGVLYL